MALGQILLHLDHLSLLLSMGNDILSMVTSFRFREQRTVTNEMLRLLKCTVFSKRKLKSKQRYHHVLGQLSTCLMVVLGPFWCHEARVIYGYFPIFLHDVCSSPQLPGNAIGSTMPCCQSHSSMGRGNGSCCGTTRLLKQKSVINRFWYA